MLKYLLKAGQPVGVNDLHIAAHARSEGLTLVTNNLGEFARVPGLLVENRVANCAGVTGGAKGSTLRAPRRLTR